MYYFVLIIISLNYRNSSLKQSLWINISLFRGYQKGLFSGHSESHFYAFKRPCYYWLIFHLCKNELTCFSCFGDISLSGNLSSVPMLISSVCWRSEKKPLWLLCKRQLITINASLESLYRLDKDHSLCYLLLMSIKLWMATLIASKHVLKAIRNFTEIHPTFTS